MRPNRATLLSVESLDPRVLPALFDLTTVGATAEVNGAMFAQYTDTQRGNETPSFLRIAANGTERGYNTDARPVEFDTITNKQKTQAITVGEVPRREIDGAFYREFFLNINQTKQQPRLSVDELQIFLGNTGTLSGYSNGKLAGLTPVFDLDAGGDNTILLEARLNKGGKQTDDMRLLVPETVFVDAGATGETFVYLYTRMGATAGAKSNGDFEEWGVRGDGGGDPVIPGPTLFDLTTTGAQAVVNGAIFNQYTDTKTGDESPSFVRLLNDGTEQGFNSDARPVQFNELAGKAVTRSITVGQLPRRTVNGVDYREFMLNINQTKQQPLLSVDQVKVFLGNSGKLTGFENGQLAGLDPVFDLDAGGNNAVILNDQLNKGGNKTDDLQLLVPEAVFAGATSNTFVYVYSQLGSTAGARANGEFEEWGIKADGGGAPNVPPPPPPSGGTASLSGRVYTELDGIPGQGIDDIGVDIGLDGTPVTITLARLEGGTYLDVATVQVDADGFYSFTDLESGTYRITQVQPFGYESVETEVGNLGGTAGIDEAGGDFIGGILVDDGDAGIDYNFEEFFVGG